MMKKNQLWIIIVVINKKRCRLTWNHKGGETREVTQKEVDKKGNLCEYDRVTTFGDQIVRCLGIGTVCMSVKNV